MVSLRRSSRLAILYSAALRSTTTTTTTTLIANASTGASSFLLSNNSPTTRRSLFVVARTAAFGSSFSFVPPAPASGFAAAQQQQQYQQHLGRDFHQYQYKNSLSSASGGGGDNDGDVCDDIENPVSSSISSTTSMSGGGNLRTGYLDAKSAAALDEELMSTPGYTLEQLMELAGLSVAEAVYQVLQEKQSGNNPIRVLVVCGPGNNGGDGLVAARHLVMFGYSCTVVYPKRPSKQPHYANLVKQCEDVGIEVLYDMPEDFVRDVETTDEDATAPPPYDAVVDSIFGFSFHGEPREPFATMLKQIKTSQQKHANKSATFAVDVPSGWNVDEGDVSGIGFEPDVLISLTAPKLSAKKFKNGRHFVGGRFLPPALASKYNVRMPDYPGMRQVVEVTGISAEL